MNTAEIINNAMQQGRNPAELVQEYARATGFISEDGRRGDNAEAKAKIAAGSQGRWKTEPSGSERGTGDESQRSLRDRRSEEFEKGWKKVFGRKR
ncbi:MAG TPA: hypothetical protein VGN70_11625 [Gammaproteobacteria bacterium]|jgi:hypothetical protein